MILPKTITTYCKKCQTHTEHKVKIRKPSPPSPLSDHERKWEEKLKGYGGKRAGKKPNKKKNRKEHIILECTQCKTKKVFKGRLTKKKLEIAR